MDGQTKLRRKIMMEKEVNISVNSGRTKKLKIPDGFSTVGCYGGQLFLPTRDEVKKDIKILREYLSTFSDQSIEQINKRIDINGFFR